MPLTAKGREFDPGRLSFMPDLSGEYRSLLKSQLVPVSPIPVFALRRWFLPQRNTHSVSMDVAGHSILGQQRESQSISGTYPLTCHSGILTGLAGRRVPPTHSLS